MKQEGSQNDRVIFYPCMVNVSPPAVLECLLALPLYAVSCLVSSRLSAHSTMNFDAVSFSECQMENGHKNYSFTSQTSVKVMFRMCPSFTEG